MDEYENASDSTRFNRELDSNDTDEMDSHSAKHDDPRISISHGIVTSGEIEKSQTNV
jgi:hypothetical protein